MAMNRGEWSEFYAILSLLENPYMNIVDENFEGVCFEIDRIISERTGSEMKVFK